MVKSRVYVGISILLVAYIASLGVYARIRPGAADRINSDDATLVDMGKTVYTTHCAACHGAQLQGQPDWRRAGPNGRLPAPPHDDSGHTWHHPDAYLVHVVEQGIVAGVDRPPDYQGNMPAFGAVLNRAQTVAVLSYIKSSWSPDYRAWQEATNLPRKVSTKVATKVAPKAAPPASSAESGPGSGSR